RPSTGSGRRRGSAQYNVWSSSILLRGACLLRTHGPPPLCAHEVLFRPERGRNSSLTAAEEHASGQVPLRGRKGTIAPVYRHAIDRSADSEMPTVGEMSLGT